MDDCCRSESLLTPMQHLKELCFIVTMVCFTTRITLAFALSCNDLAISPLPKQLGRVASQLSHYKDYPRSCAFQHTAIRTHYCTPHYASSPQGVLGTESFSIYFEDAMKQPISPWHDIPLQASEDLVNMVVEIPKFGKAKMEIATKVKLNPIRQDIENGQLRYYHGPLYWNYGALPQTWEDPEMSGDAAVDGALGDNDPLDIVEIGSAPLETGCVIPVKILGGLSMIDQNELDWKLLAIQHADSKFDSINDVSDIDKYYPGTISGIREWFRWYKTPDGKSINRFGHKEKPINKATALQVVKEAHAAYKQLLAKGSPKNKLWLTSSER